MLLVDDDGPIEKIPLWRFPQSRGNRHLFETLAAQVGRDLERHADAIGSSAAGMQQAATRDINDDFARTIPGALGEINGQLGSQSEIDPAPVYTAALESVGDLDGAGHGLPAEGAHTGFSPPAGGSEFGIVQWAESGATAPPGSFPPGGPGAPPAGSPDAGDPTAPPAPPGGSDSTVPPGGPSPAPPAEPSPPGEPSPAPEEPNEPLI